MLAPSFLQETTIRTKRNLMYYLGAMNFMFVFTILAYSIAVFLTERFPNDENAIFVVGLILGMVSFFALFIDTLWAYLQKIFEARNLLLGAIVGLFITVGIFFASHYFETLKWALFTVVAAFSYGWSYDLYEVTMSTLIFERSKKQNMHRLFHKKK